jgi:alpha-beta hydrolase superfamily lysophospholipase
MTTEGSLKIVPKHEEYLEAKDGTKVFMRSWLPPEEIEQVVFTVHGQCTHSILYRKWASSLTEHKIATFAIDLRGYGRTGTVGDAKDFPLLIDDIYMTLNEVHKRYPELPVSLLSWSMGVSMVLNTFDKFPDLAASSVILIAGRFQRENSMIAALGGMAWMVGSLFVPNARKDMFSGGPKSFMETELCNITRQDDLATKRFSRRMMMGIAPLMKLETMMRGAAEISVPTLIIHGEGDSLNPPDGSRQLYEPLTTPQKKLVMIPDMDHDLDDLGVYMGPGLTKPLTPNATRIVEEVVAWVKADHA